MALRIRNPKLKKHLVAEENSPLRKRLAGEAGEASGDAVREWIVGHPETICYGYLVPFLNVCQEEGIAFDLTYDTAGNITAGLAALAARRDKTEDPARNRDMVATVLAAVLSYLAINEHGGYFRPASYLVRVKTGKAPNRPLWEDAYSLAVGRKGSYADFLPCCKEAVRAGSVLAPQGMTVRMAPVAAEYKKLTGVELGELGLGNLYIN